MLQWLDSLQSDDPTSPDLRLTVGAMIVEEMRAAIESKTGFQCSAGISHNKVKAYCRLPREAFIVLVKYNTDIGGYSEFVLRATVGNTCVPFCSCLSLPKVCDCRDVPRH